MRIEVDALMETQFIAEFLDVRALFDVNPDLVHVLLALLEQLVDDGDRGRLEL